MSRRRAASSLAQGEGPGVRRPGERAELGRNADAHAGRSIVRLGASRRCTLVAAALCLTLSSACRGRSDAGAAAHGAAAQSALGLRLGDEMDASNGRLGLDAAGFRRALIDGLGRSTAFEVEGRRGTTAAEPVAPVGMGERASASAPPLGPPLGPTLDAERDGEDQLAVADLYVDARDASEGLVELEVALHVALPERDHARLGTDAVEAFVVIERPRLTGREEEDAAAVADAVGIAVGVAEARLALARADRSRVSALLASHDDHQVQLVLEWLATEPERTTGWAERGVLAGLAAWHAGSPNTGVAAAAVDAVARLGHPSLVPILLSRVSVLDDVQALRTYDALASLGGADAVAFLGFAARNERTLERRRAAQQSLVRLDSELDPGTAPRAVTRASSLRAPPAGERARHADELTSLRGHR